MEEKENKIPEHWDEIIKHYAEMEKSKDNLASELLNDSEKREKRWRTICLVLVILLFLTNFIWVMEFTSYDYVSQDGQGYNYYNSDVDGSVTNGAEN